MALGLHLVGEGYLLEVVFALVRVVLCAVLHGGQGVLGGLGGLLGCEQRVAHLGHLALLAVEAADDGLVGTLPVVLVLTLSPLPLKRRLALGDGKGVVEIPLALLLVVWHAWLLTLLLGAVAGGVATALGLLRGGLCLGFLLLFLLLLQGIYHAVDGFVALLLGHVGQLQERVLQVDGLGVGGQLVENLGAVGKFLIVLALLVEHADGCSVATLGVAEFLLLPIEVAELEQQHAFLHTVAGGLLIALFVGGDGLHGVLLKQIDVAHGVIYLVEVVLVVVRGGHALQPADGFLRAGRGHHFRHGDAGVESQFIGWVLAQHALVCLVCLVAQPQFCLELTQEKPFPGALLLAHLVLDDLAQVGDGLLVFSGVDVVVGVGVVPLLHGAPVERVAAHVAYDILRVVEPVLLDVAFCEPGACLPVDGRLRLVEAAHVVEGGGRLVESSLVKLRAAHEHPRLP